MEQHDRLVYAVIHPPDTQHPKHDYERPGYSPDHYIIVPRRPYCQQGPSRPEDKHGKHVFRSVVPRFRVRRFWSWFLHNGHVDLGSCQPKVRFHKLYSPIFPDTINGVIDTSEAKLGYAATCFPKITENSFPSITTSS